MAPLLRSPALAVLLPTVIVILLLPGLMSLALRRLLSDISSPPCSPLPQNAWPAVMAWR